MPEDKNKDKKSSKIRRPGSGMKSPGRTHSPKRTGTAERFQRTSAAPTTGAAANKGGLTSTSGHSATSSNNFNDSGASSDIFDMEPISTKAVKFGTSASTTARAMNTDTSEDDVFQDEPKVRFHTGHSAYSSMTASHSARTSSSGSDTSNTNTKNGSTFLAARADRDLRHVDQSVNIMSGDDGMDDSFVQSAVRKQQRNRGRTKRGSVMEIFFGDSGGSTRVNRKSMMAIDLGPDPTKRVARKSIFQALTGSGPTDKNGALVEEPFCMRMQECCDSTWHVFTQVICSKYCWLLVLICLVFVGVTFALQDSQNVATSTHVAPATSPPAASVAPETPAATGPTTEEQQAALQAKLLEFEISTKADLDNPASNAAKAVEWMTQYDPASVTIRETPVDELLERYTLATFFFATHDGVLPSDMNTTTTTAVDAEESKRHRRRRRLPSKNPGWMTTTTRGTTGGWLTAKPVCDWPGIECAGAERHNAGRVIAMNLTHAGLTGTLPHELFKGLHHLLELDLSHNLMQGPIAFDATNGLKNLKYLLLHDNALTGSLPESLGDLTALYDVDLSSNHLTGSIPGSVLQGLTNLRLFMIDQNRFEGSFPEDIGKLEKLEFLYLSDNRFDGELPFEIFSKLKRLVDLRIESNSFTGSIPPEVESLHQLEFLRLGKNKMGGEVPDVFDRLTNLVEVDLHKSSFSGPMPVSFGKCTTIERLNLEENEFTGSISSEWASLTNLQQLMLHSNKLTGSIPTDLGGLIELRDLWLNNNKLSGSLPTELGKLTQLVDLFVETNEDLEGTVPSSLGDLKHLAGLNVHGTKIGGTMPKEVCSLKENHNLKFVGADCLGDQMVCDCCDKCY